jgi:hypothetical protein
MSDETRSSDLELPSAEILEYAASLWDPRIVWKCWLEAASETVDAYLRSADFLELMQRSLRTITHVKNAKAP